jgi:hypothetical protein
MYSRPHFQLSLLNRPRTTKIFPSAPTSKQRGENSHFSTNYFITRAPLKKMGKLPKKIHVVQLVAIVGNGVLEGYLGFHI